MNFPVEIPLGPISLSAHLLFETLGFILGFRFFLFLRHHQPDPIPTYHRIWILVGASAGALLFSRLVGALEDPLAWWNSPNRLLALFASKTIVGGLLGGLLGVELTKHYLGQKNSSGDLFVFPLMLGIGLGRIGCFLNGIYEPVYGVVTNWITGMDLGDGLRRHPLPLYEIAFLVLFGLLLWRIRKQVRLKNGMLFRFFMIGYLAFRLGIEFLKPTEFRMAGLTTIQMACIAGLLYYYHTIGLLILKPQALKRVTA